MLKLKPSFALRSRVTVWRTRGIPQTVIRVILMTLGPVDVTFLKFQSRLKSR